MIVSAYSDGEKKDKIAEFYDTTFPCAFMKGLLAESQEQEKDIQITFSVRHKFKKKNNYYSEEFMEAVNEPLDPVKALKSLYDCDDCEWEDECERCKDE